MAEARRVAVTGLLVLARVEIDVADERRVDHDRGAQRPGDAEPLDALTQLLPAATRQPRDVPDAGLADERTAEGELATHLPGATRRHDLHLVGARGTQQRRPREARACERELDDRLAEAVLVGCLVDRDGPVNEQVEPLLRQRADLAVRDPLDDRVGGELVIGLGERGRHRPADHQAEAVRA